MQNTLSQKNRSLAHYSLAAFFFALYGIQVCPFTEALDRAQLVVQISSLFALMFIIRQTVMVKIQNRDLSQQPATILRFEFSLFVLAGISYGLFNYLVNDFPPLSGLKVLVGISALGCFISIEQTIAYQLALSQHLADQRLHMALGQNVWSLARKFGFFATAQVTIIFIIFLLVIIKDLEWLGDVGTSITNEDARRVVIYEIAFISVVLLGYTLRIINVYAKNQNFFLVNEGFVLQAVAQGNRDLQVPVTSNDELGHIAFNTNLMIGTLSSREQEITVTRDVAIMSLASLAEARDNETGAHILRTQYYVKILAEHLKSEPDFSSLLDDETIDLLFKSAPLHDIGKVGIPDNILLKPGKLTVEEFEIMKTHAQIGSDALAKAEGNPGSNSFLKIAKEITATHHEKWDGSGYPQGLQGDNIPLSGRLMALADVYDALISKRVYKEAFSHEHAKEILVEGSGQHFDPRIVKAFINCEHQFIAIAAEYGD